MYYLIYLFTDYFYYIDGPINNSVQNILKMKFFKNLKL